METPEAGHPPAVESSPIEVPPAIPPDELRLQRYPEDLRAPWGWADLLAFVLVTLGLYFGVSVAMFVAFFATGKSAAQVQNSPQSLAILAIISTLVVAAGQFGYLYVRTRLTSRQPFWQALGWRSFRSLGLRTRLMALICILGGFAFALLIGFVSDAIGQKHGIPMETFFQDRRSALMLMILGITLAPIVEETVFRGFMYPVAARTLGIPGGVVATGVLFGLLHAPQLWGAWAQIGLLVVVGIVFTYVRARSHTVLASYLLHISYNSYLFAAFVVVTHGLKNLPAAH
ncbi:MAG: CPBP family intramembrane glutamic endopeptidase [Candidatus Acidiferrales bacterium]